MYRTPFCANTKFSTMLQFFNDIAQYDFLQNALFAALLTGLSCGIIGSYMVVKRMVFLGGGITHSSFGGVGLAYYLGMNTTFMAAIFALLSAFSIERFKSSMREDTAIGILWSLGMALGIFFIVITPGYAPNLMSFLFGSILTVSVQDLLFLIILNVVILLVFTISYRAIVYTALDEQFAKSQGFKVGLINLLMICLVALTIVLNIKTVGIMLLMSLLTIPTAISSLFCKNFSSILIFSALFAILGLVLGIIFSYIFDFPAAAATVILLGLSFFLAKGFTLLFRHIRSV